jgi:Uma2 family endonuclease
MRESLSNPGPLTIDEYFEYEKHASRRHEYVSGRLYVMQGTTARHNKIVGNLHAMLRLAAKRRGGACDAYFIDLKVRAGRDRVYYPDVVTTCAPHDGDTLLFDDPLVIVEVTSPSTRRIDRGEKLDAYLTIPTLRAYLIVEHDRRHITLYSREGRTAWSREEIVTTGCLTLGALNAELSLDEIYERVEMPPLSVREPDDASEWDELEVY